MIEVKNVTKKYGNFVAVNDVSFTVKDNEVVGFLGPNGAGKSTTMNMITGYIEPSKGKIIVEGYDVSKSPRKAKKAIGYMPETVPLYPELTVKEFVNYMADLKYVKGKNKKTEIEKILAQTGLTDVQNKLIRNISRGYKQRVSLAGALIGNPKVLILDEPTVGLDPKQITEIRELIKKLGKNHTVILSSHILSEVSQICERVVIINKGNIIAVDTPTNLEEKTREKNSIFVTVEDKKNKMKDIKAKLNGVTEVNLAKDNNDGTKQYEIVAKNGTDIRKEVFEILPKEDVTIFELKKPENTLEDAFLKLINEKEEEAKALQMKATKEKMEREERLNEMTKQERKLAIKEEKKKEKEAEKEAFDRQWEKEKEEARKAKEEKKAKHEEKVAMKKEIKNAKKTTIINEKSNKDKVDKKVITKNAKDSKALEQNETTTSIKKNENKVDGKKDKNESNLKKNTNKTDTEKNENKTEFKKGVKTSNKQAETKTMNSNKNKTLSKSSIKSNSQNKRVITTNNDKTNSANRNNNKNLNKNMSKKGGNK